MSMFFAVVQCKRIVEARVKCLMKLSVSLESAKILLGINLIEEGLGARNRPLKASKVQTAMKPTKALLARSVWKGSSNPPLPLSQCKELQANLSPACRSQHRPVSLVSKPTEPLPPFPSRQPPQSQPPTPFPIGNPSTTTPRTPTLTIPPHSLPVVRPKPGERTPPIKTQARAATILPHFVGLKFQVHNGKVYHDVTITEEMVGHKLGEFSP